MTDYDTDVLTWLEYQADLRRRVVEGEPVTNCQLVDYSYNGKAFEVTICEPPAQEEPSMLLADLCDFYDVDADDFSSVIAALTRVEAFACGAAFYNPQDPRMTTIDVSPIDGDPMAVVRSFSRKPAAAIMFTRWLVANVLRNYHLPS